MDDFCHVDDFVWHRTREFELSVIDWLKEKFVTSQEFQNFRYLGLHIEQKQNCVVLDRLLYIDVLSEAEISLRRISKDVPLKGN